MAATIVRLCCKAAVGIGAVYVTIQQGVWSNGSSGTDALRKVQGTVLPAAQDYFTKVPTINDAVGSVQHSWNSGIRKSFEVLTAVPNVSADYARKAVKEVNGLFHD